MDREPMKLMLSACIFFAGFHILSVGADSHSALAAHEAWYQKRADENANCKEDLKCIEKLNIKRHAERRRAQDFLNGKIDYSVFVEKSANAKPTKLQTQSSKAKLPQKMRDPVLAATPGAVGETEAKTDEFDLGDLDF